jgi:dual specificity phosphatase 12
MFNSIFTKINLFFKSLLGVSRSATLVLAYLMSKEKRSLNEIYEFVKQKRYIRPNNGFIKQLEIFEAMSFIVDKESQVYKSYMLDKMAENIKKGANINDIIENQNNIVTTLAAANTTISHYKCKKCRLYLFNINNRIKHLKSYEKFDTNDWNSKLMYFKKLNNFQNGTSECSKEIFIEPISWLIDKITDLEGKVSCCFFC